MKHLITIGLWAAAILVALGQRALPFLVLLWQEFFPAPLLISSGPSPAVVPFRQPVPLCPADVWFSVHASTEELAELTRRQLQRLAGTRRNLPKQQLIEMILSRQSA